MPLEPGQTIAHYRIDQKIGQGGMGIVYLAVDTKLGRRIALKVLPAEMSASAERRARFEREARAIAALNHPNIVTIHSVEEVNGVSFLTMELVDGRPLKELLTRDGLPLPKLIDWSIGITDAMAAAHRAGVVHRDMKPDNVMVTGDGRIKVLDFGLAKLRETAVESKETALPTTSITEEGKILGTVSYMSPEQAEGKSLDHRSDIFSFGVVLYEMATGRRPFQGETAISTISSILKDTPTPPQQINTALPLQLGRIVKRCLAKEPERRYNSTDDLRNELIELKEESSSGELTLERAAAAPARAARLGASKGIAVAGIAGALVLAAALGIWLWQRGGSTPLPAAGGGAIQAFHMSRATTDGKVEEAAISPDGRYLAYVRRDGANYSLRLRQVATGEEVQVVAPSEAGLTSPAFSSDADFLHYISVEPGKLGGAAFRVSVLGGTPRRIVEGLLAISPSPDGRLAMMGGTAEEFWLRIAGPDGEQPVDVAKRKGGDHFDTGPAWSSDGRSLAIVSHRFGQPQQIVLIDTESHSERPLALPLKNFTDIVWIPGKNALFVTGSERPANQQGIPQVWEVPASGTPQPLTRDLNSYADISVTADGSAVAVVQTEHHSGIDLAPVRNGVPGEFTELFPIGASRAGFSGLAWLPGEQLAHSMMQGEEQQVFVSDPATRSSRALTQGASSTFPLLSPDGRTMIVERNDGSHRNLWRLDPETGRTERLTEGEFDNNPVFSADGRWIFYTAAGETIKVLKVPVAGGTPVEVSSKPAWCFGLSADDRLLCVVYGLSGDPEVVLIPPEGGEPVPFSGLPTSTNMARVSPDGRSLAYLMTREGADELLSTSMQGGEPRVLARFEGKDIRNFAFSSDGSRIAVVRQSRSGDVVLLKRPPS